MRPRLVLFGASITEQSFASGGWGAALAHHFVRQADVVLRGLSGYNTRWVLKVLDRAMEGAAGRGADPAAVTVLFGSNDASLPDRHVYGDNDPSRQPERTNEAAGTYAQACIAVAKELDHPVLDIWTQMQQFPDWQTSALCDRLHFTPFGNKIFFDEVLKTLESIGFSQHSLRSDLPLYHEIDPKDPLKAFEI
ncbi:hypothetical protein ACQ4PT_038083 [Festuca glaucescens]